MSNRCKYDWPTLLQEFSESELTQAQFCQNKGINAKYFSLRRARFLRQSENDFVKVEVNAPKEHGVISFKFSGGEFCFDTSVDPHYIATLIRAL